MKRIFIDMDNTSVNFTKGYLEAIERNPKMAYPQSQYGFFANLEVMDGFRNFWETMTNDPCLKKGYELWFLTAPSVKNPLCYTEKRVWVEANGFPPERLIICPDKSLLKGDYLIDDNSEGKGQDKFEGFLIHFGKHPFPTWACILDFFITL